MLGVARVISRTMSSHSAIESKLASLNYVLPAPSKPVASYVMATRVGNLIYTGVWSVLPTTPAYFFLMAMYCLHLPPVSALLHSALFFLHFFPYTRCNNFFAFITATKQLGTCLSCLMAP